MKQPVISSDSEKSRVNSSEIKPANNNRFLAQRSK